MARNPKATPSDLFNSLSYHVWQTGIELREKLENQGKRVGHLKGIMYFHLSRWEDEELVSARIRPPSKQMVELTKQLYGSDYEDPGAREYLRISSKTPEKLFEMESGLEKGLLPSPA